jgi:hypothetical protein
MTDRRRLVPIVTRRRIERIFGMPPAALQGAKILTPSRRLPRRPPAIVVASVLGFWYALARPPEG